MAAELAEEAEVDVEDLRAGVAGLGPVQEEVLAQRRRVLQHPAVESPGSGGEAALARLGANGSAAQIVGQIARQSVDGVALGHRASMPSAGRRACIRWDSNPHALSRTGT